jgi:hypothetical protein
VQDLTLVFFTEITFNFFLLSLSLSLSLPPSLLTLSFFLPLEKMVMRLPGDQATTDGRKKRQARERSPLTPALNLIITLPPLSLQKLLPNKRGK